jgi:hypothetical protein
LNAQEQAELNKIRELSDKKIHKICKQQEGAFEFLWLVLTLARTPEDQALIVRVWDLVPNKHQVSFAKEFSKRSGLSLTKMIEEIRAYLEAQKTMDEEAFVDSRSQNHQASKKSGSETELVKLIYRKLVRHLHPDLQSEATGPQHWQSKIWHRVQTAYQKQDRRSLEKLYRLVLIRARHLNDLSVSEILESQSWLKEELESLNQEAQGLKSLPAWGFSKRKDYSALKRKLAKPLQAELEEITDKIDELKEQHAYLELVGVAHLHEQRRRPKNRRRQNKKSKSK